MHRRCGLPKRNQWVRPMNLIDIDIIGLQAAQRVIDLFQDSGAGRIAKNLFSEPVQSNLGRNDNFFPLAVLRQGSTDELFSTAKPVHWRRINKIYAALQRRVNRLERLLCVGSTPVETSD